MGKKFKDLFGNIFGPVLSGLVGLTKPRDHGVPYSLTEEFVSVYRIHSLLPDEIVLRNIKSTTGGDKCPPVVEKYYLIPLTDCTFLTKILDFIRVFLRLDLLFQT